MSYNELCTNCKFVSPYVTPQRTRRKGQLVCRKYQIKVYDSTIDISRQPYNPFIRRVDKLCKYFDKCSEPIEIRRLLYEI